ncbi:MAG: hypothetical protein HY234_07480 [Acidobacteria bacterium]|nr:hypothetical protein [Acidobacteriota bacterium]MBI3662874.1 hypothetical protein [Acidobacteriota bacterium]
MTNAEYFARPDTPMENSPVGKVVVQLLEKRPGIGFEDARQEAKRLLAVSAGHKEYHLPRVQTPEQEAAAASYFSKLRQAA